MISRRNHYFARPSGRNHVPGIRSRRPDHFSQLGRDGAGLGPETPTTEPAVLSGHDGSVAASRSHLTAGSSPAATMERSDCGI